MSDKEADRPIPDGAEKVSSIEDPAGPRPVGNPGGPLLVRVRSSSLEVFLEDHSVWMSESGMVVRTGDLPEVGTRVRLDMRAGEEWKLVQGAGRVAWARREAGGEDEPVGFGIEFVALSEQSRKLLRWIEEDREASRAEGVEPKPSAAPRSSLELVEIDEADPGLRPKAWEKSSRSRRALVAAGLILFLAIVAVLGSRLLRRGEPTPGTSGAEAPKVAAQVPDRAPATAAGVHEVVEAWAAAWRTGNAAEHLSIYGTGFVPPSGMSRAEWEAWRTEQIEQAGDVRIGVEVLEVDERTDDTAVVTFEQAYRTDTSEDLVLKELELAKADGRWVILAERVVETN